MLRPAICLRGFRLSSVNVDGRPLPFRVAPESRRSPNPQFSIGGFREAFETAALGHERSVEHSLQSSHRCWRQCPGAPFPADPELGKIRSRAASPSGCVPRHHRPSARACRSWLWPHRYGPAGPVRFGCRSRPATLPLRTSGDYAESRTMPSPRNTVDEVSRFAAALSA